MWHSSKVLERCIRLAGMSWDELRVRTRQEAAKRWHVALRRIGIPSWAEDYNQSIHSSGRFFFSQKELPAILGLLHCLLPDVVNDILVRAEQICRHRFDLLGYHGVDYGEEIDWHLDAVHGKQAPRLPWFRISYLDFEQVGDSKITWELSRHQHLVTLAKAYRLTGNTGYVSELVQQWYHWQKHNPYGIGINWSSSLEIALRSLSWIWILQLLSNCSTVPQEFPADVGRALIVNANHIERFLSTYFSPNTHLLGEGVGLFFVGVLAHGATQARHWRELGWQIVLQEAKRQVQPDGMHFEQSVYYHVYALDFLLHARILAGLNGIDVPAAFDQTIKKMLKALCSLAQAGSLPNLGDDDGGRVFDPQRNGREYLTDPLSTGTVLFGDSDFKGAARTICEETLWLLGREGAKRFSELGATHQKVTSFALKSSGTYVMCSADPASQKLVIDAGPQAAGRAGHGHADALSVQLALDGHPLLIDPGTSAYVSANGERDWFRGTAAHNTVQVDGLNQADPAGPFGWRNLPKVTVNRWVAGETFDLIAGSHNGYTRLSNPVVHQRHVFYLKPRFWFIRDILEGEGPHEIEASWHFAPGKLSAIPGGAQFWSADHAGLVLLFAGHIGLFQNMSEGLFSPVYGQKGQAPTLSLSCSAHLPMEFATLLVPMVQSGQRPGLLRKLVANQAGSTVQAYAFSEDGEENHFIFSHQPGRWEFGPWASDARLLFGSTAFDETLTGFIICDGSYLEFHRERVFASKTALARAEWFLQDDDCRFSCSDDSSVTLGHCNLASVSKASLLRPN